MSNRLVLSIALFAALGLAAPVFADPPRHAPAHGYRAKHKHHKHKHERHHHHHHDAHDRRDHDGGGHGHDPIPGPGGFQVVFDPDRGVSIAVGFPGVAFHQDHYYRHHDGFWQRSLRADRGWERVSVDATPDTIRRAFPRPPVPAKMAPSPGERVKGKGWKR
jgi:hypothetical protein